MTSESLGPLERAVRNWWARGSSGNAQTALRNCLPEQLRQAYDKARERTKTSLGAKRLDVKFARLGDVSENA